MKRKRRSDCDIAGTIFVYDARNRLTREIRVLLPSGTSVYDLTYTYDLGGNRRRKTDTVNQKEVIYIYDIDDPNSITANNRLMEYDTNSTAGGQTTAISTVFYCYNVNGNVTAVTRKWENPPAGVKPYRTTQFVYARNQQAVTHVVGVDWDEVNSPVYLYARGFRYDGARQRYLVREYDPASLPQQIVPIAETWTDYDGDQPYGDFTVRPDDTINNLTFHELGIGEVTDPLGMNPQANYGRADQIGTTRALDESGMASSSDVRVYTAFGELIDPGMNGLNRYGYAGAFGYEKFAMSEVDDSTMTPNPADTAFPFLHVGARWYDPATGRFLQRDPLGIIPWFNVYEYVGSTSTVLIDPNGLQQGPPIPPDPVTEPDRYEMWNRMGWWDQGPNNPTGMHDDPAYFANIPSIQDIVSIISDIKDIVNKAIEAIKTIRIPRAPTMTPGLPDFFILPPGVKELIPSKRPFIACLGQAL